MKKLLSMALAMVLLCASMASMGVLASDTVIMSYGFEAEEDEALKGPLFDNIKEGLATVLDSTVDTSEPVKPVSGTKYIRLENVADNDKITTYSSRMPKLEAKTQYKLSFYWHGGGTFEYPAVKLSGPISMNNYKRFNYVFPKTGTDAWMKIEVYFVTDDTIAEEQKLTIQLYTTTKESKYEYYDDFKLEKVDGASIRFISGTPSLTTDGTLTRTVQANATRFGYYQPKNTYSIGAENPYIWPVASSGVEAKTCTGDINIVSHYVPKTVGEKTILIAAIYKDINGVPSLLGMKINNTCEYPTTAIAETTAMAAHNRMDLGFDTLTINASELEAGCYIECFMWSSTAGLIPVSGTATLGK